MTRRTHGKALVVGAAAALLVLVVGCGEQADRDRNVQTVAGSPCAKAGQVRTFARVRHVCGRTTKGLTWFVVGKGRSTRCAKPGELRVVSGTSQVCSLDGKRKMWVRVASLPSAMAISPTTIGAGDAASGVADQTTTVVPETTVPETTAPIPATAPTAEESTSAPAEAAPSSTVAAPETEVVKASLDLSSPVKAQVVSMPAIVESGGPILPSPSIQLVDESGNPRGREGVPVRVVTDRPDVVVRGGEARTNAEGLAVFAGLTLSGPVGPVSVLFEPSGMGAVVADAELRPGAPAAVRLLASPLSVTAGEEWDPQPVVVVVDDANNVVDRAGTRIDARLASGKVLGSATTGDDGFAVFQFRAGTKAENLEVEFSGPVGLRSASSDVTILPTSANRVAIDTAIPEVLANGESIADEIAVRVIDGFGNTLKLGGINIALSAVPKIDGEGTQNVVIPEPQVINGEASTDSAGVARFVNPALEGSAGEWRLVFTVVAAVAVSAVIDVTLVAGAASSLETVTEPAGARSGVVFEQQPAFRVVDKSGNPVDPGQATVSVALKTGYSATGSSVAFGADGVARFSRLAVSGQVGQVEVEFGTPLLPTVKKLVNLTAGVVSQLVVVNHEVNAVAGARFGTSPRIEVQDAAGNRVGSGIEVVARCGLVGNWVSVATVDGVATFSTLTSWRSGSVTCTYQVAVGGEWVRATATMTVVAGNAAAVEILDQPPRTATMGVALGVSPRVRVVDRLGNAVEKEGSTIRMYSTSTLLAVSSGVATTDASGVARFAGVVFGGLAGTYRLEFAVDGGLSARAAADTVIAAGAPARLVILTQLRDQASGVAGASAPVLAVYDNWFNAVDATGWVATLGFTGPLGAPEILSGRTANGSSNGSITFGQVTLRGRAGSYTPTYTVSRGSVALGQQGSAIQISAGRPARFSHTVPQSVASGGALGVVTQYDSYENVVTGIGLGTVSVSYASGSGVSWVVDAAVNTVNAAGATVIGQRVYGASGAGGILTVTAGDLPSQKVSLTLTTNAAVGDPGPSGGLILTTRQRPEDRFIESAPASAASAQYYTNVLPYLGSLVVGGASGWSLPTPVQTSQMMAFANSGRLILDPAMNGRLMVDTSAVAGQRYMAWVSGSSAKQSLPYGTGYVGVLPVRSFG